MNTDTMVRLTEMLTNLTQEGKIEWQATVSDDIFQTIVSGSLINVERYSDEAEGTRYFVNVHNKSGDLVLTYGQPELNLFYENKRNLQSVSIDIRTFGGNKKADINILWQIARAQALDVEGVLANILQGLDEY